ncbi:MAG: DNA polymerase III subunit alpha [Candidatus Krumholzibacteria bacterium]|nr:DNA polymerase III subunit alpha [Candidatus Krumholzibacteria bacterium]
MSFVHLRVHSNFSMLAGTRPVEDLARAAAEAGMPALALTDTDGMYAVVPFQRACEEAGIRPIHGVELTGALDAPGESRSPGSRSVGRVTLLARTREGYGELCRLVTRRRLDADFSLGAALDRLSENVYVLADDERVLARLRGRKNAFAALPTAIGREWTTRRWRLRREATRLGLRTVAAGEVYFLEPREHFVHRVLTAIRTRTTVGTLPPGAAAPSEAFFHSPADVERVFHDDSASIDAALEIADSCRFDLDLHSLKLPRFALAGGEEPFAELRRLALRGLKERMGESECVAAEAAPWRDLGAAESTLERELAVVRAKGLADYFLICWDIVRFARSRGMSSVGRGSAGNSLISYALKITHVNPLRHNLFFERFLNPERTHLPDFDIDFGTDDREEVLRYIFRRYGAERVAMIGTYSTLKARAAIREVSKALGIPEGEVDLFIKRLPYFSSVDRIEEKCAVSPAAGDIPFDREPLRTILKLAVRIGEFPRHMATHPCGLVICPEPITNFIPLQRGDKGYEITQWSMHEVEAAGLLKIDIIGQKGLAVIGEAAAMAAENAGRPLHPDTIDYLGDTASREALRAGRTEGCFYIESPAMVQLIRQAKCDDFEVLTALSSIIRPGVSSYGGKRQYLHRHLGLEPVSLIHPALEPVLADTCGCLIYQEQVIRIAVVVAGMSLGEADGLRRCMSFKNVDDETFASYRASFMRGALARGIDGETAGEIFRQIASFAGYAFCKAHSASFALESFESVYWKTHYPAEFMAAVLSNGGGYYSQSEYLEEARRMGLEILPPSVNESAVRHRGRSRALRIGLMQVKGLSVGTAHAIVAGRLYGSLAEFLEKVPASRGEVETLIRCGAMSGFGRTRPELLWELRMLRPGAEGSRDAREGGVDAHELIRRLPRISEYDLPRRIAFELETLDLAVSGHPLEMFGPGVVEALDARAGGRRLVRSTDLPRRVGEEVDIVGWKVTWKSTRTQATMEEMIFVTFSDQWGRFEATFFPEAYRRAASALIRGPGPFLIRGRVESELGVESLVAESLSLVCEGQVATCLRA